jgi:hypothetical protein
MTATRSIVQGVEASAAGTLVMDTLLYRRYRGGGGSDGFAAWESSDGVDSWERAPAPALVAKKLLERVSGRAVSPRHARALNNLMHWSLGLGAGAGYGLLFRGRKAKLRYGPPFGAVVWAGGYVVLPRLGVYEDIWKYDLETLEKDLSAHLVFGAATAAAYSLLAANQRRSS